MEYEEKRKTMVQSQLIPRGITDNAVLNAMYKVPRHLFMDQATVSRAYDDMALPIGKGQTISQPYMVAVMTELLELSGVEKVLEIGTGSGYQTAVLAETARSVYTVERIESLGESARKILKQLNYENIYTKVSDGTEGWIEESPYDRIIITASAPDIPSIMVEQLADGGIILGPVGDKYSQKLLKLKKEKGSLHKEYHVPCVFVPLIGKYGWEE